MEEKMRGIVLGGTAFGENDKILNVFTLEQGVISAKIKGVKKAGAKLKFASEPFCFAEFIFSVKGTMRTVIGASLIDSFYPVREDIVKYFAAGTILEFAKKFYKENIVSPDAFFLVVDALKSIAYSDGSDRAKLIKFLLDALEESGYKLSVEGCGTCHEKIEGRTFFDYRSGAFFCKECFSGIGREVNPATLNALCAAKNSQHVKEADEGKALRLLEYYLENRTDEKFNSLSELNKISN